MALESDKASTFETQFDSMMKQLEKKSKNDNEPITFYVPSPPLRTTS
jgi:hypothetical protein